MADGKTIFGVSLKLILGIVAFLIAQRCNPGAILIPLFALFVPEIYLLQFGVRKYLLNEIDYCSSIIR